MYGLENHNASKKSRQALRGKCLSAIIKRIDEITDKSGYISGHNIDIITDVNLESARDNLTWPDIDAVYKHIDSYVGHLAAMKDVEVIRYENDGQKKHRLNKRTSNASPNFARQKAAASNQNLKFGGKNYSKKGNQIGIAKYDHLGNTEGYKYNHNFQGGYLDLTPPRVFESVIRIEHTIEFKGRMVLVVQNNESRDHGPYVPFVNIPGYIISRKDNVSYVDLITSPTEREELSGLISTMFEGPVNIWSPLPDFFESHSKEMYIDTNRSKKLSKDFDGLVKLLIRSKNLSTLKKIP